MARAEYLGNRVIWAVLIPALVLGPVAISAVDGHLMDSRSPLVFAGTSMVIGVATMAGFALALLFVTAPRAWRLKLPSGSPVFADFGPEVIGIGWAGHHRTVARTHVTRVRRIGSVLHVRGAEATLLLPLDLVPASVAAELLSVTRHTRPPSPRRPTEARRAPEPCAVRSEREWGGITYTSAIADDVLTERLSSSVRRSPADFGPQRISVRLGPLLESFGVDRISDVRHVDSALVFRLHSPSAGVVIPDELVPTRIGRGLLRRFGPER
ncbi:hypothetical protein [Gordonia insulae]|nr:hypothetical protein [Gordonia insulae]